MYKILLQDNSGNELWIDFEAMSFDEIYKELESKFGNNQALGIMDVKTNKIYFLPAGMLYDIAYIKHMIDVTSKFCNQDLKKIRYLMNIENVDFETALALIDSCKIIENMPLDCLTGADCYQFDAKASGHALNVSLADDLNLVFYENDAFLISDPNIRSLLNKASNIAMQKPRTII